MTWQTTWQILEPKARLSEVCSFDLQSFLLFPAKMETANKTDLHDVVPGPLVLEREAGERNVVSFLPREMSNRLGHKQAPST